MYPSDLSGMLSFNSNSNTTMHTLASTNTNTNSTTTTTTTATTNSANANSCRFSDALSVGAAASPHSNSWRSSDTEKETSLSVPFLHLWLPPRQNQSPQPPPPPSQPPFQPVQQQLFCESASFSLSHLPAAQAAKARPHPSASSSAATPAAARSSSALPSPPNLHLSTASSSTRIVKKQPPLPPPATSSTTASTASSRVSASPVATHNQAVIPHPPLHHTSAPAVRVPAASGLFGVSATTAATHVFAAAALRVVKNNNNTSADAQEEDGEGAEGEDGVALMGQAVLCEAEGIRENKSTSRGDALAGDQDDLEGEEEDLHCESWQRPMATAATTASARAATTATRQVGREEAGAAHRVDGSATGDVSAIPVAGHAAWIGVTRPAHAPIVEDGAPSNHSTVATTTTTTVLTGHSLSGEVDASQSFPSSCFFVSRTAPPSHISSDGHAPHAGFGLLHRHPSLSLSSTSLATPAHTNTNTSTNTNSMVHAASTSVPSTRRMSLHTCASSPARDTPPGQSNNTASAKRLRTSAAAAQRCVSAEMPETDVDREMEEVEEEEEERFLRDEASAAAPENQPYPQPVFRSMPSSAEGTPQRQPPTTHVLASPDEDVGECSDAETAAREESGEVERETATRSPSPLDPFVGQSTFARSTKASHKFASRDLLHRSDGHHAQRRRLPAGGGLSSADTLYVPLLMSAASPTPFSPTGHSAAVNSGGSQAGSRRRRLSCTTQQQQQQQQQEEEEGKAKKKKKKQTKSAGSSNSNLMVMAPAQSCGVVRMPLPSAPARPAHAPQPPQHQQLQLSSFGHGSAYNCSATTAMHNNNNNNDKTTNGCSTSGTGGANTQSTPHSSSKTNHDPQLRSKDVSASAVEAAPRGEKVAAEALPPQPFQRTAGVATAESVTCMTLAAMLEAGVTLRSTSRSHSTCSTSFSRNASSTTSADFPEHDAPLQEHATHRGGKTPGHPRNLVLFAAPNNNRATQDLHDSALRRGSYSVTNSTRSRTSSGSSSSSNNNNNNHNTNLKNHHHRSSVPAHPSYGHKSSRVNYDAATGGKANTTRHDLAAPVHAASASATPRSTTSSNHEGQELAFSRQPPPINAYQASSSTHTCTTETASPATTNTDNTSRANLATAPATASASALSKKNKKTVSRLYAPPVSTPLMSLRYRPRSREEEIELAELQSSLAAFVFPPRPAPSKAAAAATTFASSSASSARDPHAPHSHARHGLASTSACSASTGHGHGGTASSARGKRRGSGVKSASPLRLSNSLRSAASTASASNTCTRSAHDRRQLSTSSAVSFPSGNHPRSGASAENVHHCLANSSNDPNHHRRHIPHQQHGGGNANNNSSSNSGSVHGTRSPKPATVVVKAASLMS